MPGRDPKTETPGKIIYLGACLIAAVRVAQEDKWDNSRKHRTIDISAVG